MVDFNKMIQGLAGSGAVSGFAGGLAGTALAGALSGKKGRKVAKSALKVGAVAAVGGLAYTAYKRYRQNGGQMEQGATTRPDNNVSAAGTRRWEDIGPERFESAIEDDSNGSSGALLLIRSMIAAAASDGHMDNNERDRIFAEVRRLELSPEEKATLFDELRAPLNIPQIVAQVTNPETAVEVYAASLVAIDESRPEGQTYLRSLAVALDLPEMLVNSVHGQVEEARKDRAA